MSDKVFVNDTVDLILETLKNVSTFTKFLIKYEKPGGVRSRWASAKCPASDTCLRSTVTFDTAGLWKVQAYVGKVGENFHGLWADIYVYPALSTTTTLAPTTVPPTTLPPTT